MIAVLVPLISDWSLSPYSSAIKYDGVFFSKRVIRMQNSASQVKDISREQEIYDTNRQF